MALPNALRPHKDKIIMLGLGAGALYAAAVKFELAQIETLQGVAAWVVLAVGVVGAYAFYDAYMTRKKIRRRPMPSSGMERPSPENLGLGNPVPPPSRPQTPQDPQPIPGSSSNPEEDIFKEFQ